MSPPTRFSRRVVLGAVMAVTALALAAGCGGNSASSISVQLSEQAGSGQSGTASFTSRESSTSVVIELSNPPAVPQPSHIHRGTCANPDPQPAFPLSDVEGGSAESLVVVSLEELRDGADYYVNVHESSAEIETVVACGDIAVSGGGDSGGGGYGGRGY